MPQGPQGRQDLKNRRIVRKRHVTDVGGDRAAARIGSAPSLVPQTPQIPRIPGIPWDHQIPRILWTAPPSTPRLRPGLIYLISRGRGSPVVVLAVEATNP
jgi:hypothetical protein